MAIQDTPIKNGPRKIEDKPVRQTERPVGSRGRERFEAAQAAFIDTYNTGNSPLANFKYYQGVIDKRKELQRLSQDKANNDYNDLAEEFVANPYGEDGSIETEAEAVRLATQQAIEAGQNPDQQFAESISAGEVDFEQIDAEGSKATMHKMLSDWQEEIGGTDILLDIGEAFVPWRESYEGFKVTGSYFGSDDDLRRAIYAFRNKPEEEQVKIFPQLKAELEEKVGKVDAVNILTNFLEPLGEERSQPYGTIEKVFDAIDLTGAAGVMSSVLKASKGGYNIAKSSKNLGNEGLAKDVSIASMAEPEYARASGMNTDTAIANGLPFDVSLTDPGYTKGLSAPIVNDLEEFFGKVDRTAEDIMLGNGFLKEGIVNTTQRARLEADAINRLKAEKAEEITETAHDANSTTYSYKIRDEDGNVSEESYTMQVSLSDAGHWEQSISNVFSEFLASPTAFAKGTLREDVDTAQNIDYLSSRMNKQLFDLTRDALKPIGLLPTRKTRDALARVDKALVEGDEWKNLDGTRGVVFRPDELREKFSLNENEISAYYRVNRLYNNLFNIRNHEKRVEMEALGYKNVNLPRSNESMAAKPFQTVNDARLSLRRNDANYIYDVDADEMIAAKNMGDDFLDEQYALNKNIVRVDDPYDVGGDRGRVQYLLTSSDDITELPATVLQRKKGYVPRVYEDNVYFAKEVTEGVVDGNKPHLDKKTLRFFSNKKDADTYIESLIARAIDEEGMTELQARAKYKVLSDREEETLTAASGEMGHGSGGLYFGTRAQDDILFGLEGTKPNRLNSFESLTRNIGNVSRFASINQWRLGMEQRWINSVNELFKAKGINRQVDHFEKLPDIAETHEEVRFFNRIYDQIRDWQNFPTAEEKIWQSSVQRIYDWAANRGYRNTAKFVGNFRTTDPVGVARATAFHSLLGWFNPSQLWVQMQGMMVAASVGFGRSLTRNLGETIALHSMDAAKTAGVDISKNMARVAGMSSKDLKRFHELWEQTGYKDSVLQTADHAAAARGYGMTRDMFRRMSDTGLIFYRNGELTNRRLSFATSVSRWMEKNNKTLDAVDDRALKSIMNDANNMMLNMTRGNRAQWQKGFLSLPTQFLQVTTKFLETATGMNRNFTAAERGKLFASQFLFYGTAGVPLANLGTNMLINAMGITQKEIDENPGLVKAWNDGLWGASTYWIMGADIEMASRGSLLRGVGDFVDNWFIQESTIAEKMLGAFGSTGQRFWDNFTHRMRPYTLGPAMETDWTDAAALVTQPFLSTVSTYRNIEKAVIMNRLDTIYSNDGRVLDTHEYSLTDELAQAMGFQQTRAAEAWSFVQLEEASQSVNRKTRDYVLRTVNEFAAKYPDGGYSEGELAAYLKDIEGATAHMYPDEKQDLMRSMQQAYTGDSSRARAIRNAMNSLKENTYSDMLNIKSTLTGQRVLRITEPEEQEE